MESKKAQEPSDKMLDIDEGPSSISTSQPSQAYKAAKEKESKEFMQKVEKEMDQKAAEKKVDHDKVYQVMKILTAMKLVKEDGVPKQVTSDLYIGSIGAAYNKKSLEEYKITHILTCAANIKPSFPNDYKYEILDCLDSPNQSILTHVEKANTFIKSAVSENVEGEEPKNRVLVHCFAGKSRATSFLLAYLLKEKNIPLDQGLKMIWEVRPQAAPNPGFMIQLKALEKNVLGKTSAAEVMQGDWKSRLQQLQVKAQTQKEKRATMTTDELAEPLSPEIVVAMPDEDASIQNVEKQHEEVLGKLLGKSGSHDALHKQEQADIQASQQKELADAQEIMDKKE